MSSIERKNTGYKAAKPMVWVRGNDGSTYICPKSAIKDPKNVSGSELGECLDESDNPQNN